MAFLVVRYGCESWTIKKVEHQRIDDFELRCRRRFLRVPWTTRRSNQSTLKEINPEYSLEGLTLKYKLQCFGHLMQRTVSLEKTLIMGKREDRRRSGWQRVRWLDSITDSMDMGLSKLREIVKDKEAYHVAAPGSQRVRHKLATKQQWSTQQFFSCFLITTYNIILYFYYQQNQFTLVRLLPSTRVKFFKWISN